MTQSYRLDALIPAAGQDAAHRLAFFAFLNLGFIESLANGLVGAVDAVRQFYHAENCLFVRKTLKDKAADRIMGHGVQLPDLFDALPAEKARREFLHELATMRSLCLGLLEAKRRVA